MSGDPRPNRAPDDAVALAHHEQGPADAPAVVLAPSLGTTLAMWDDLAAALAEEYRVIRFDTRGHGASPVLPGPYSTSTLADDVVALADTLGLDRFAVVGLSLGGALGQVLALEHPDRLSALVLCCTGPSFGDPQTWRERATRVRAEGMAWLVEPTKDRWFTPQLLRSQPEETDRLLEMIATTPPEGYDVSDRLEAISAPTRVVAGAQDPVSPPSVARTMVEAIPDADLVVLDDASHIASSAQPAAFNRAVREHLTTHLVQR
jgi:3-oxoadipate enol-lactonase